MQNNNDNNNSCLGKQLDGECFITDHSGLDSEHTNSAQVVIIGAGLAGLSAAERLYESGFREVLVLDAQERVGGRVHTIEYGDYLLEMGAQWLHGADQNPLYKWLTKLKMLDDFEDASAGFNGLFCTPNGDEINPWLVEKIVTIMLQSKLALSKDPNFISLVRGKGFESAKEVFRHQLDEQLESNSGLIKYKRLANAIFEWFLRYETIENCCDNIDEVSIASYTDWADLGDGTLLNFKQGYSSLLSWFCQQFPAQKWIKLNKQVVKVELLSGNRNKDSAQQQVLIHFKSATDNDPIKTISCSHVIVTCSLGFLKKNHETFFEPQLADWRKQLIHSLGFGTVNKIVLHFDSPFWSSQKGIKLVWWPSGDQEENCGRKKADKKIDRAWPNWSRDIIGFDTVRRQPNVLIGWIGGEGAKEMESFSDQEVGRVCLELFHQFLPTNHQRPTKLIGCFCTRWNSNEFICGSYSFQSTKSFGYNIDKLHEPIYSPSEKNFEERIMSGTVAGLAPRVLFAGEATSGELYSTTHGAIISGWREADRLKDFLYSNIKTYSSCVEDLALVSSD